MNYHKLAKVLNAKYELNTSETVGNLLSQLHSNPLARLPHTDHNPTNEHVMQRLVTADALDDADRGEEAKHLRDLSKHVMIHEDKVKPARTTLKQLRLARNKVEDLIQVGNFPYSAIAESEQPHLIHHFLYRPAHSRPDIEGTAPIHEMPKILADHYEEHTPEEQKTPEYHAAIQALRNHQYEEPA